METLRRLWISASLYHPDFDLMIKEVVCPLREQLKQEGWVSKFIFNRSLERGENLIVMCEVPDPHDLPSIKSLIHQMSMEFFENHPGPEKIIQLPVNDWFLPFPNNHLEFNDHFLVDIMETGGLQAALLAENLLAKSSDIILDFMSGSEEPWSIDASMALALQLHVVLMLAFDRDIATTTFFSSSCFSNLLSGIQSPREKDKLVEGLRSTFDEQKETFTGFVDQIASSILEGEEFEEEWLNEWYQLSIQTFHEIRKLQRRGEFIAPEGYTFREHLPIVFRTQEVCLVIEYYLRAINAQLGIVNALELNLVFSLQESFKSLTSETYY